MITIVETDRLALRELTLNDTKDLAEVLCNPDSMKYYSKPFTINEVEQWIIRNIDRYKTYGYGLWAVILKQNNKLIGDCGVTIQNIDNEYLPEIGFHIHHDYCQKGYATEAGKAVINYCNKEFKLKRIYSNCNIENIPSQRTMNKIGLEFNKKYIKDGKEKIAYLKTFG